jgi:hypothetical protein
MVSSIWSMVFTNRAAALYPCWNLIISANSSSRFTPDTDCLEVFQFFHNQVLTLPCLRGHLTFETDIRGGKGEPVIKRGGLSPASTGLWQKLSNVRSAAVIPSGWSTSGVAQS